MEKFLRKLKLIDDFSISLNTRKTDFIIALSRNVDFADIDNVFSSVFEVFSSSKNRYKGSVNDYGFKIRKRRRLFEPNFGFAKAIGIFTERNESLKIETKVNAWNNFMFFYFGFVGFIYLIFIGAFSINIVDSQMPIFIVFFLFFHASLMFGIPYFIMRRNVRRTKEDLEREFIYIINKQFIAK